MALSGDLLHMDTARYARFKRPGHAVTGDRSQRSRNWMSSETRVDYDFAHTIVGDHSRLAYVELLRDEKAATVTGFVERALAWFGRHGISTKRLMTDNAWSYTRNRSLRELLAARSIKHLTTQAYRPRTNGAHTPTANKPCHTGYATTTSAGHTARSRTGLRSAAFTTSVGRTAS